MITSTSNARIKNVIQLLNSGKTRREQNAYVIEGLRMFSEAPVSQMRQIFVTEEGFEKARKIRPEIGSLVTEGGPMLNLKGPSCELVSDEVFKRMSDTRTPQGILCVMNMPNHTVGDLIQNRKKPLMVLILEGLQDPGNLGTMLRSGEAAGVSFILADRQTADLYNPKVIRSTMGAIYRVPVIYTGDLLKSLRELKAAGVSLYAAHLAGRREFWDEEFSERCGIMIGNEGNGLSDEATELADVLVRIPMEGQVESLNAGVAASLLMYEYRRKI